MKSIIVIASLMLPVLAQQATIVSPAANSTIAAGSEIVIEVHQDRAATDDVQVAILLGFRTCASAGTGGSCAGFDPAADGVGQIVFGGAFSPAYDPAAPRKGLHQDFTFVVPSGVSGPSALSLAHLQAVGAVKIPEFNVNHVIVNVE